MKTQVQTPTVRLKKSTISKSSKMQHNVIESHETSAWEAGLQEVSLHDYRISHPHTAAFPTLTQSGLLALVLARQQQKILRRARRKATYERLLAMPGQAINWTVQEMRALAHHRPVNTTHRHA